MNNLKTAGEERDFFVWVDPSNWLIQHQVGLIGSFTSVPNGAEETLMFLPNPRFQTFISSFQNNLLRDYMTEYNLEVTRKASFPEYPFRLKAVFLFGSESEAQEYKEHNIWHVGKRILKRVKTVGTYKYSVHDSGWVDFMRIGHSMDENTIQSVTHSYWKGMFVKGAGLISMGRAWSEDPIMEVLFLGRVDFYDKKLDT